MLLASIIRRDRVKTAIWVVAILGLVIYTVATYQATYGTPEQLATYARVVSESPAARAFSGPGYGLAPDPTLGAVVANETLSFLTVGVALMSIFLVVRNTRAEEEDGRAELLAAGQISRHARTVAALFAAVAASLTIGLSTALLLIAYGLDTGGALVYGAALAGAGVFFAALALLSAQVSIHARVANAIAGGALGVAYLLRALGDMAESGLSWLSPIGWVQSTRPFAGERPWVLALLLVGALVLVAFALALERRRDIGAGMVGSRPGSPVGRPYLSRPFGLPVRIQRVALVSWAVAASVLGLTYGSVTDEVEQMVSDSPDLAEFLAQTGGDLVDSYLVTVLLILALVATGFAIQSLLRIRAEETSGRAEAVLATALSRRSWSLGYLAVTAAGVALIQLLGGATIGLGYLFAGGEAREILDLAVIALAWVPAVLVAAALALLVIAFLPRLSQAAWGLLGIFAALAFFGEPLDLPAWVRQLSPFEHVPRAPADDLSLAPVLALVAAAAILALAGLAQLRRRDIG